MPFKRLLLILLVMVYYFNLPIAKKNKVDKQVVTVTINKRCECHRSFQMTFKIDVATCDTLGVPC